MKRLLSVAVVGIAALLPLTSHAQMRGMGGRGSAGFSRSSSGFRSSGFRSSGFRSSGTVRTFAPSRGVAVRGFAPSRRVFVSNRSFAFRRFPNRRFFFGRGCFGCRFPFFGSSFALGLGFGFGYPYYPYPYYPYYPSDYYYPPAPAASYDSDSNGQLANEVHRLSDEVEDLRSEESRSHSDARQEDRSASQSAPEPAAMTTFVLRDGRRIGAQNYAITGQTIWIFNEHTSRRIPLADLDVAATEKANSANGVEFHLPEPKH